MSFVALHIASGSPGSSSAIDAIFDDIASKINQHIAETAYPHPDFVNATNVSTVAAPNANTLVKRDSIGGTQLTGLTMAPSLGNTARVVHVPAGANGAAGYGVEVIDNNGSPIYSLDQYGNLALAAPTQTPPGGVAAAQLSARSLFLSSQGNGYATLSVQGPPAPTGDIFWVGDNGGTLANRYLRVGLAGNVTTRWGLSVGAAGAEILALDSLGQIASDRSIREFAVTLSAVALTGSIANGKYIDVTGVGWNNGPWTFTVTSDATKFVWWAISLQAGGTSRAVANTAGGNAVAGSALKAAFSNASDYFVGYVLVPPTVTTLAAATFDDWRNAGTGDGNTAVASFIGSAPNINTGASAANLGQMLAGSFGKLERNANSIGITGATTFSVPVSPMDFNNGGVADWRLNAGTITVDVNTGAVTGGGGTLPALTAANALGTGYGFRYIYADANSVAAPLYTLNVKTTNTISNKEKLLSVVWWDGTAMFSGQVVDSSSILFLNSSQVAVPTYTANWNGTQDTITTGFTAYAQPTNMGNVHFMTATGGRMLIWHRARFNMSAATDARLMVRYSAASGNNVQVGNFPIADSEVSLWPVASPAFATVSGFAEFVVSQTDFVLSQHLLNVTTTTTIVLDSRQIKIMFFR